MTVGHSEYWSPGMRAAMSPMPGMPATNLAFFAGNLMYWKAQMGIEPVR